MGAVERWGEFWGWGIGQTCRRCLELPVRPDESECRISVTADCVPVDLQCSPSPVWLRLSPFHKSPCSAGWWESGFSRHTLCPGEHRFDIGESGTIPVLFSSPPTALNQIVFTVIGDALEINVLAPNMPLPYPPTTPSTHL